MRFSWDFLQNMLENDHSNLQTNLWVHITSNIFKIIQFKNHGIAPTPPNLPTLKAYPTPSVGGRFGIFSLKWRERMNLKVPGAILPLGCAILSTRAKTVGGVVATPLGELGLRSIHTSIELRCSADMSITFCCNSTQYIAFRVEMNLTLLRHRSAVTPQSLCSECSAAMQC